MMGRRQGLKAVFIGGGALRHLSTLRGALAEPGVFDDGHIVLYDLNPARAQAMGRMVCKTPEYARCRCRVSWDLSLPEALTGADVVSVVLMAGTRLSFALGHEASLAHGYLSSDNLSPNGAMLAIKTAPILQHIATQMRRHCPQALLLNFANPVAVMSALVNHHYGINTLGVCAGYTNHQWDIPRLLGRDVQDQDFDLDVAGVNHLSYILGGTWRGRPLLPVLQKRLAGPWRAPRLSNRWSPVTRSYIRQGLKDVVRHFRDLGVLVFSTESDGMAHLDYATALARVQAGHRPRTPAQVRAAEARAAAARRRADQGFTAMLERDLDAGFWSSANQRQTVFGCERDIFVRILTAVARREPTRIIASRPHGNAVRHMDSRAVLEYTQVIRGRDIRPGGTYEIPPVVRGLTTALATHQTMLADALAAEDPRAVAQALRAYPVGANESALRRLYRDLFRINRREIAPALRATTQYL